MTDITTDRCPSCGVSKAAGEVWSDLCPRCLLSMALSVEPDACPYSILAPMAESASGVIYLAHSPPPAVEYVALKIYAPRTDAEAAVVRYRALTPALRDFRHRHLARLLDVGLTADGRLFVASAYAAGWPLTSLAAQAVPPGVRVVLARHVAEAIEAAHAIGLVHLALAPRKVKCSTTDGGHTTLLGMGVETIVNGASDGPERDVADLERLVRGMGVALPERQYRTAGSIAAAVSEQANRQ